MKYEYRSRDFYLTCICMASGCKLEHLEKLSGNLVEFVFQEQAEKCTEIISRHWAGELKVNSKKIVEAIVELKTRLHNRV